MLKVFLECFLFAMLISTYIILISDNKKVPNLNTVLKQINKLKLDVIEANFQKVSLEEILRTITSDNNSK